MSDSNTVPLRVKQYTISPELYHKGYPHGHSPCMCTSVCCQHGVYADVKERDRILEHRDLIKKYMDETQSKNELHWFEHEELTDADFSSGRCVGTEVVNNKCAFLDKAGRCSIQVATTSEGRDRWELKPIFCILFPIEISNNVIGFDDLLDDEQPCCSIDATFDTPMFRACKDELVHLLGEDGYQQIEEYYEERVKTRRHVHQPKEAG
jgi:hypothetical protein